MRLIVFLRVYVIPLILVVLLCIRINNGISPFSIFTGAVFIFAVIMIALLTDKHYVQKLVIDGELLRITYTNQFLEQKIIEFETSKIKEVKLSKRRIIAILWPPDLNIQYETGWMNFIIVSKDLFDEVQSLVSNRMSSIIER